jgi:hypothetical protein
VPSECQLPRRTTDCSGSEGCVALRSENVRSRAWSLDLAAYLPWASMAEKGKELVVNDENELEAERNAKYQEKREVRWADKPPEERGQYAE